jgi:carbonic anhydrase
MKKHQFLTSGLVIVAGLPGLFLPGSVPGPENQQLATRTVAPPPGAPHWDYEEHGPAEWGKLSPDFAACGAGKSQSPIDIANVKTLKAPEINTQYRPASLRIVHTAHTADVANTGHTIQVNYTQGDTLTVGADAYVLVQYHFHSPSEHTIHGKHFPMEMHMVHQSADKKLAVLSVLIEEGNDNKAFEPVWANLPKEKGHEAHLEDIKVDVNQLLPKSKASYRYDGSLTTPPCSEGVKWIVMKEPVELSADQIKAFQNILRGNNRPVQPLHGRVIYTDQVRE